MRAIRTRRASPASRPLASWSSHNAASETQLPVIQGKRVMVVLPTYNAGRTLEKTISEIPMEVVDDLLLVDDASGDDTVEVAERLGIPYVVHSENRGYGGNQKTCYTEALKRGADIVTMLHPDYQYSPRLIEAMVPLVASGEFDIVLGSRIL